MIQDALDNNVSLSAISWEGDGKYHIRVYSIKNERLVKIPYDLDPFVDDWEEASAVGETAVLTGSAIAAIRISNTKIFLFYQPSSKTICQYRINDDNAEGKRMALGIPTTIGGNTVLEEVRRNVRLHSYNPDHHQNLTADWMEADEGKLQYRHSLQTTPPSQTSPSHATLSSCTTPSHRPLHTSRLPHHISPPLPVKKKDGFWERIWNPLKNYFD
jgi:hypothetical protein